MGLDPRRRLAEIIKSFRYRWRHLEKRIFRIQPFQDGEIFIILNTVAKHLAPDRTDGIIEVRPWIQPGVAHRNVLEHALRRIEDAAVAIAPRSRTRIPRLRIDIRVLRTLVVRIHGFRGPEIGGPYQHSGHFLRPALPQPRAQFDCGVVDEHRCVRRRRAHAHIQPELLAKRPPFPCEGRVEIRSYRAPCLGAAQKVTATWRREESPELGRMPGQFGKPVHDECVIRLRRLVKTVDVRAVKPPLLLKMILKALEKFCEADLVAGIALLHAVDFRLAPAMRVTTSQTKSARYPQRREVVLFEAALNALVPLLPVEHRLVAVPFGMPAAQTVRRSGRRGDVVFRKLLQVSVVHAQPVLASLEPVIQINLVRIETEKGLAGHPVRQFETIDLHGHRHFALELPEQPQPARTFAPDCRPSAIHPLRRSLWRLDLDPERLMHPSLQSHGSRLRRNV